MNCPQSWWAHKNSSLMDPACLSISTDWGQTFLPQKTKHIAPHFLAKYYLYLKLWPLLGWVTFTSKYSCDQKYIRHFKQIIFFNSSLKFRNWSFYTSKVRSSLPELNSQCRNWSFYTSKVRNSLPELGINAWSQFLTNAGITF